MIDWVPVVIEFVLESEERRAWNAEVLREVGSMLTYSLMVRVCAV